MIDFFHIDGQRKGIVIEKIQLCEKYVLLLQDPGQNNYYALQTLLKTTLNNVSST